MSTGLYTHVSKAAGVIVTAPLYNNAHVNHVNNDVPPSAGAHSDDVTQYRAITDPAPGGVATPVADLGLEIEQLRFVIKDIKTALNMGVPPTWWYTPINPTAANVVAHGARVFKNTFQAVPNNTETAMSFNTIRYDTGVILPTFDPFFNIVAPTRLTATASGLYQFNGFGEWNTGAVSGILGLFIRLNGSKILASSELQIDGTAAFRWMITSTQYLLAKNDYVELIAFQTAGSPFNIINPDFAIELLNPSQVISPPVLHTLTVNVTGSGAGTVTSSPGSINTSTTQSESFVDGTVVQLTATPTAGSFIAWSGDVPVGHELDNPLTITMDQARTITATFNAFASIVVRNTAFTNPSTTNPFFSLGSGAAVATHDAAKSLATQNIVTTRMYVRLNTALIGGGSATWRLNVNGVTQLGLAVTIASGASTGNAVGTATINDGDFVSIETTFSGGTTNAVVQSLTLKYGLN
jgi:hypothetical protein